MREIMASILCDSDMDSDSLSRLRTLRVTLGFSLATIVSLDGYYLDGLQISDCALSANRFRFLDLMLSFSGIDF